MKKKYFQGLSILLLLIGCSSQLNTVNNSSVSSDENQLIEEKQELPTETPILSPTETSEEMPQIEGSNKMNILSSAFENDMTIPSKFACHGYNVSPQLSWSDVPNGTQSFTLVMDDPDAVPVAGYVWDHWLIYNIPSDSRSLSENISSEPQLEDGSTQGLTSFGSVGYGGPCPPAGQIHKYFFTLYALDAQLNIPVGIDKVALLLAIDGHVLAESLLVGNYP